MPSVWSGAFMALAAGLAAEPRALTAPQREMREELLKETATARITASPG